MSDTPITDDFAEHDFVLEAMECHPMILERLEAWRISHAKLERELAHSQMHKEWANVRMKKWKEKCTFFRDMAYRSERLAAEWKIAARECAYALSISDGNKEEIVEDMMLLDEARREFTRSDDER